ncbi:hypothetical protein P8452_30327 [Trifolium repens]|nr:hypothetical protein P8452_30327 [Trifolium repens]
MNSGANSEGVRYGKDLALALQQNITKIVKEFKEKHKGHEEIQQAIPEKKPAKRGRRDTTKLVGEGIVSFAFPSTFDTSKFKNINLLSSLEDWKLEYRMRATGVCDPYFIPATGTSTHPKKFKSITEVVNYLLPKEYTKLPSRNRKRKNIEAKEEEKNLEERDADIPPIVVPIIKKRRKNKNKNFCFGSFSLVQLLEDKENTPKAGNISTETLSIVPALQTPSPPRISEMQHGVPPDDGGLENILVENKVEEESNKINTCPGSSSSPQQIENNPEEGDASMETTQNEFSSSLLEMLAFVPLDYGVDDICKENEPTFPLNEGGYGDTFNGYFDNQLILQEEIAEEVHECDQDFHECDDWFNYC